MSDPKEPPKSAFIIGVTGYMDLARADIDELKLRVDTVIRFIRFGVKGPDGADLLGKMVANLAPADPAMREVYEEALKNWPGLPNTPIIVLSSLAPGADTLVADKANDLQSTACVSLRAPLPFPPDLYIQCTTFKTTEQRNKFTTLSKPLEAFDPSAWHTVRLKEDFGKTETDLARDLAPIATGTTPDVRSARHERYYAAGEYIDLLSHLVIAIWDGTNERGEVGTAAVVRARMNGPRARVFTNSINLALPHGGPVLHLVARRKDTDPVSPLPPMRFLHPYVFESGQANLFPGIIGEKQEGNRDLQLNRLATFCKTARELDFFNSIPTMVDSTLELEEMLQLSSPELSKPGALEQVAAGFRSKLDDPNNRLVEIAGVRRKAAHESGERNAKSKSTLRRLFFLAFGVAFLAHVFAHGEVEQRKGLSDMVRSAAAFVAFAATLGGLVYFARARKERLDEQGHDYRALAEGLRVQFYWNLAGLGRAVAASYMQRQRSELDWIRGAIRAISFPYHRATNWFATLTPDEQKVALGCVRLGWIQGQLYYYTKTAKQDHYNLETHHRAGGALALAAIWTFVACACPFAQGLVGGHPWIVLALGLAALEFERRQLRCTKRAAAHAKPTPNVEPTPKLKRVWWQVITDALVPHAKEDNRTVGQFIDTFLSYLPVTIGLAAIVQALCHLLARDWLPKAECLQLIAIDALLVGAALFVALAEKRLFSEFAYQYNTMASLFLHAEQRMKSDLDELENLIPGLPAFGRKMEEIQQFLFALGQEALDEHAEWLLLHRARPLEPVMP